jgi:PPOX class probable F420-dependent enzyme
MDEAEIRRRVDEARVARMGTIDESGRPHLVPIVFVVEGDRFYSTSDPVPPAKRVRNIQRGPRVTVLIDFYDEDWQAVWWVRLRGDARIVADKQEEERAPQPSVG